MINNCYSTQCPETISESLLAGDHSPSAFVSGNVSARGYAISRTDFTVSWGTVPKVSAPGIRKFIKYKIWLRESFRNTENSQNVELILLSVWLCDNFHVRWNIVGNKSVEEWFWERGGESDRLIYPRDIVIPFTELRYWFVTVRETKKLLSRQVLQEWSLEFDYGCKNYGTCSNARDVSLVDDKSDFRCMNERPVIRCIRCITQMLFPGISYCTVFGFTQILIYLVAMRYQFYRLVESIGWYISLTNVNYKVKRCVCGHRVAKISLLKLYKNKFSQRNVDELWPLFC